MSKWRQLLGGLVVVALVAVGIRACSGWRQPPSISPSAEGEIEAGLTLRDVTLEQPDEGGNLLWKVDAQEVTYSPDRQVAYVKTLDGDFYQDGQLIYRVQSETGEIRDNGKVIFLRGNIVATGVESGAVLRGNELEWRPDEDRMIVRNRVTGSHPQIQAVAQQVEVFNRESRMVLQGDVMANTVVDDPTQEPWLKLQAEQLLWFWQQERLESERPLRVEQFENNRVRDVVTSERGQLELATEVLTLQQDVEMQLLAYPLQLNSEAVTWRIADDQVETQRPIRVFHPQQQVRIEAERGQMDLAAEQVVLTGDVYAQGQRNQAELLAEQLIWNLGQQRVVAEGNVRYQQLEPELRLRGPRAVGLIEEQQITVTGGGGQVVTEIVPE